MHHIPNRVHSVYLTSYNLGSLSAKRWDNKIKVNLLNLKKKTNFVVYLVKGESKNNLVSSQMDTKSNTIKCNKIGAQEVPSSTHHAIGLWWFLGVS